jgi:hypothetical protein
VIGISGGELLKRPGPDVGCRAIEEEGFSAVKISSYFISSSLTAMQIQFCATEDIIRCRPICGQHEQAGKKSKLKGVSFAVKV